MQDNVKHNVMDIGKKVLRQEAQTILSLADNLDPIFEKCVELLLNISGRVAVSGIGKSGHVGRKIAATFASTGTPAYFIHPTEAAHGDLGMMLQDDILLVLSNSGNTEELAPLLGYATKKGMLIMAITKNAQSTLGRLADFCLVLPPLGEACPFGCAPTSSTTATLALGDALAMAVLQVRGFDEKAFNTYHPGGALGKQLRSVAEIMHTKEAMPLVCVGTPMSEAIYVMTGKGFGCTGVLNTNNELVGIITDGDLRRHMSADLMQKHVQEVMTENPIVVEADCAASKAGYIMHSRTITGLFVVQDKKPIGFVHLHDCV